jgi:hypothetical protein
MTRTPRGGLTVTEVQLACAKFFGVPFTDIISYNRGSGTIMLARKLAIEYFLISKMIKIKVINIHTTMMKEKGGGILCGHNTRFVREQFVSYAGNNIGTKGGDEENYFPAR